MTTINSRYAVVAVLVVTSIATGVWLRAPDSAPDPSGATTATSNESAARSNDERIQQLQQEIVALRQQLDTLQPLPSEAAAQRGDKSENAVSSNAAIAQPATTAESPPSAHDQRTANVSALERRFAAETSDGAWSINTEREFADGLRASVLPGTALIDVACRHTLCRIGLTHADDDAEETFFGQMPSLPGLQETELFYTRDKLVDGATHMVLYVARQGYPLRLP